MTGLPTSDDPFAGIDGDGMESTAPMPAAQGRTQAEIDAEIAKFGDIPLYEPSTGASDPGSTLSPAAPEVEGYDWIYGHEVASPLPRLATSPLGPPTEPLGPPTEPFSPVPTVPRVSVPPPAAARQVATQPSPSRTASRPPAAGGRAALVTLVLFTCLALGAAATVVAYGWQTRTPAVAGAPAGEEWTGQVATLTGLTADASCVAGPGVEDGRTVTYDAAHLLDGDPATAWRCDDSSTPLVTFTIPEGMQVAEVGLINGYTKRSDGVDLYPINKRTLLVEWTLPDGTVVQQNLADDNRSLQRIKVPVTGSGQLSLRILRVNTTSTNGSVERGSVVISEVALFGPVL